MATRPIPGSAPQPLDPRTAARQGQAQEAERTRRSGETPGETQAAKERPRSAPGGGERVQISDEARQLLQLKEVMDVGRSALEREPEVRAEKVRQVKARLEAGVYQTQGIRDEVAHRLSSILRGLPLDPDA